MTESFASRVLTSTVQLRRGLIAKFFRTCWSSSEADVKVLPAVSLATMVSRITASPATLEVSVMTSRDRTMPPSGPAAVLARPGVDMLVAGGGGREGTAGRVAGDEGAAEHGGAGPARGERDDQPGQDDAPLGPGGRLREAGLGQVVDVLDADAQHQLGLLGAGGLAA